jgi:hypothetical protein
MRPAIPTLLLAVCVSALALTVVPVLGDQGEQKVSIDQVPEAVRKAIESALGDGRLVDIGVFARQDGKVYEIEMVVDGKEYDVLFAEDGKVLRKTFEGVKKPTMKPDGGKSDGGEADDRFQRDFDLSSRDLSSTGRNRFFILVPGYRLVLEGKEGDHTVRLVITVLDDTRRIGGVETRVVEERESVDGKLVEISRNFFAICKRTTSVFYFGEEVDLYEDGEIVGHEGAWLHGEGGANAGLIMPGEPVVGARYYQEVAPGVAMDRAEVVDLTTEIETPAGEFEGCLRVREENPLDEEQEFKIHAPGIGLVRDEDLVLVEHGFAR